MRELRWRLSLSVLAIGCALSLGFAPLSHVSPTVAATATVPKMRTAAENLGGSADGFSSPKGKLDGTGQIVVVIDGAFNPTHPSIKGRVLEEACFGEWAPVEDLVKSACSRSAVQRTMAGLQVSFESGPGTSRPNERCVFEGRLCHDVHGTAVASAAAGASTRVANEAVGGVAPGANLILLKVGRRGGWNTAVVPAALSYVSAVLRPKYGARIAAVNISAALDETPVLDGAACPVQPMTAFSEQLKAEGIAVTVAAGNAGLRGGTGLWSCQESVVAVGATNVMTLNTLTPGPNDLSNPVASDASDRVDLVAPVGSPADATSADGVWVAWPYRTSATTIYENNYNKPQGTSFAAPQIAGAFAVLRQQYGTTKTVDQLVELMASSGVPVEDTRKNATNIVSSRVWLADATNPRTRVRGDFTGDGVTDVPLVAGDVYSLMLFSIAPDGSLNGGSGRIVNSNWTGHRATTPVSDYGAQSANGLITTTGTNLVYHRYNLAAGALDGGATVLSGGAADVLGMTFAHGLPNTVTGSADAVLMQFTNGRIVARQREQFGLGLGAEQQLVAAAAGKNIRLVGVADVNGDGAPDLVVRDAAGYPAVYGGTGKPKAPFASSATRFDSGSWWPGTKQVSIIEQYSGGLAWLTYVHAQGSLVHIPVDRVVLADRAVGSGIWNSKVRYLFAPRAD